jgi:hypothetical protein
MFDLNSLAILVVSDSVQGSLQVCEIQAKVPGGKWESRIRCVALCPSQQPLLKRRGRDQKQRQCDESNPGYEKAFAATDSHD